MEKITKSSVQEKLKVFNSFLKNKVFTEQVKDAFFQFFVDLKNSMIFVFTKLKKPNKTNFIDFLLVQVVANACGWTAGILSSKLVSSYFKTRGLKNLWGLAGRKDGRTMLSKADYEFYSSMASYFIGLVILICVRYFIFTTIKEYRLIKEERALAEKEKLDKAEPAV